MLWTTTKSHIEQFLSIPRKKFSQWQWFLECSPEAFPTRKVLDQLWLQTRLAFHFIMALGAVGLAQVATTRSHIEQSLSIPRKNFSKWHWFSCMFPRVFHHLKGPSPFWLEKSLVFHFIVVLGAVDHHKKPH